MILFSSVVSIFYAISICLSILENTLLALRPTLTPTVLSIYPNPLWLYLEHMAIAAHTLRVLEKDAFPGLFPMWIPSTFHVPPAPCFLSPSTSLLWVNSLGVCSQTNVGLDTVFCTRGPPIPTDSIHPVTLPFAMWPRRVPTPACVHVLCSKRPGETEASCLSWPWHAFCS